MAWQIYNDRAAALRASFGPFILSPFLLYYIHSQLPPKRNGPKLQLKLNMISRQLFVGVPHHDFLGANMF